MEKKLLLTTLTLLLIIGFSLPMASSQLPPDTTLYLHGTPSAAKGDGGTMDTIHPTGTAESDTVPGASSQGYTFDLRSDLYWPSPQTIATYHQLVLVLSSSQTTSFTISFVIKRLDTDATIASGSGSVTVRTEKEPQFIPVTSGGTIPVNTRIFVEFSISPPTEKSVTFYWDGDSEDSQLLLVLIPDLIPQIGGFVVFGVMFAALVVYAVARKRFSLGVRPG